MKEQKSQYVEVALREVCSGVPHLESFFQDVLDKGGEGVILRDPNALYQAGRATGYLKHKVRKEKNHYFMLFYF